MQVKRRHPWFSSAVTFCPLIHHEAIGLLQFYPCSSAEVPVASDPVRLLQLCARVVTNSYSHLTEHILRLTTLASRCGAHCKIIMLIRASTVGLLRHNLHQGALLSSFETTGSTIIALWGP